MLTYLILDLKILNKHLKKQKAVGAETCILYFLTLTFWKTTPCFQLSICISVIGEMGMVLPYEI